MKTLIIMQHQKIIQKAQSLGIEVEDISELMQFPFAILRHNGKEELFRDGVPTSYINVRNQFFCDNKQLTKIAYEALEIPYPKSIVFKTAKEEGLLTFFDNEKKYVCKPLDATNGIGVEMGIKNMDQLDAYLKKYKAVADQFMLEEQVEGVDLRIHVLGGIIVAACIREPAYVIGNGKDDLNALIEKRRGIMKGQNPNNYLDVDDVTEALLKEQKIQLIDVPATGQKVRLKRISNMAQGGIATDITDQIHPAYHEWVAKLVKYLDAEYMGIDLMTNDHQKDPMAQSQILEINARADWAHHTFSEVRTHEMDRLILEMVFNI